MYGATTIAAESLIAQLHSHGKLTTLRRENQKIRQEIETLKANELAPYVKELDLSNDSKKHTTKSHETIPLMI
jgi:GH35 family endo-1,4-beta-xylanase